jgi:hypothetical protein
MGLDASVSCRCYADHKTRSPPPHAEHVELDDEGYVGLRLEWSGHREEHEAFRLWKATCCEHANMEAASERISNWAGVRALQSALAELGWERFPVLREHIPDANGGSVSPDASAAALDELARFTELVAASKNAFLVDADTGAEIFDYIPQYEGLFLFDSASGDIGFDPRGIFVRLRDPKREIFRAMHVEQRAIAGDPKHVRLVCLDTQRESPPVCRVHGAARLRVVTRARGAADFDFILRALRVVFRASVATGNPVRWC